MRPVVSALLLVVGIASTLGAQKHRNPPHAYAPRYGGSHECALTPQAVFSRMNLHGLALANAHGCALAADRAFCWGPNNFGEVGNGTTRAVLDRPVVVGVLPAKRGFPIGRRAIVAIGFGAFLALAFFAIRFAGRPSAG